MICTLAVVNKCVHDKTTPPLPNEMGCVHLTSVNFGKYLMIYLEVVLVQGRDVVTIED